MTTNRMKQKADDLRHKIRGAVLIPGDAAYEDARRVWNAVVDRRPAVIVRCAEAADLATGIPFARENQLDISVRGGGHHIGGHSVCDDGLMIDFSAMKVVRVDSSTRRALVWPG